ncbi:maleylpyruvate isomerase family mycothiol-dependent enzyme [Streptacidiphilus sp. PB12-B1b]|uniref:maleylpyruvate isomerase N-terminal domain-containing protein n=1 Tax=Streptacidiphilus sp. PB12-B1b TaxID=2705012 RepID=UPI0015FA717E|nr:maleylpyruvate isomerase N-terminal domain-containing protein [Streptacidiphilus sp. PB12-B1b]QMU78616.1 maleylpyruvate isomerase family mycothiol-dependent enzyme [Streptacidiphilus sp. PB12-B1b]
MTDPVPPATVAAAEERLLRTVGRMRPEQVFEPSALPGWTRGHVLTHLARNADALVNLLTGARTGTPVPMYPSAEARDRDIEAGAGRPLDEQLADLRAAGQRFAAAAAAMPEAAWAVEVPHRLGAFPASGVPRKRYNEVEYHHVDLGLDYTPGQWPADFVDHELEPLTDRHLRAGALTGALRDAIAAAPGHARLAWLSGRSDGAGLGVPVSALPTLPPLS